MNSVKPSTAFFISFVSAFRFPDSRKQSTDNGQNGFSLLELLIAVVILVIAIVPLMDSITASFQYAQAGKENTIILNYARQKMEDVLAMHFDTVPVSASPGTPTALSDTITIAGQTVNRLVLVDLYDGDGDAVPDSDLKKVTVIIQGLQYESLMAYMY
ncbi:MAG: prepilin-type N-terminal cleavage/methylation domain-containing protein [Nitrospiraceae bacterium]|nr:MAG: prepilin-type N-terminal cleavage/methylation domain-containing protein [Nitrospiraceae bacterium]